MNIQKELSKILKKHIGGAFLFVGSGFSRRYLGLEDWEGLLTRFCDTGKSFKYYKTSADGNLAKAAELLADDFHNVWWNKDSYSRNRLEYEQFSRDKTSALRIEISHYLKGLNKEVLSNLEQEVELLKTLNIDGIITTNWDTFLEYLYPEYKVYVGQQELLFSNPQEVGEIYKIHGCATNPESLILTQSDYERFEERNAYLAAKLITIFIEHPIIFIGYSLNDKNIQSLLKSIVKCVDTNNLEKLRRNLIFINRTKNDEPDSISESSLVIDQISLPITLVKTNDFSQVYNSIKGMKRKISARILRHFKEQFYEFVYTSEPTEHILVSGIDEIKDYRDVDFVVGVGVKQIFSEQGYSGIKANDLIDDILNENKNFIPEKILDTVLSNLVTRSDKYVPIHYYLNKVGVNNESDYIKYKRTKNLDLDKFIYSNLKTNTYKNQFERLPDKTFEYIVSNFNSDKSIFLIPFLSKNDVDLDKFREFLIINKPKYIGNHKLTHSTIYRKLVVLYDKWKWGW